jgi:hypothetical protein
VSDTTGDARKRKSSVKNNFHYFFNENNMAFFFHGGSNKLLEQKIINAFLDGNCNAFIKLKFRRTLVQMACSTR